MGLSEGINTDTILTVGRLKMQEGKAMTELIREYLDYEVTESQAEYLEYRYTYNQLKAVLDNIAMTDWTGKKEASFLGNLKRH